MSSSPSQRIITKIADEAGTDETNLPPLYDTIDPDQLNALIQTLDNGRVSFTYAGYEVTVTSENKVTISAPTPPWQS